jgi:predicted oxidoreductase (fatty acid repression mutant protein)
MEAVEMRRSRYAFKPNSSLTEAGLSEETVEQMVRFAVDNTPSAFNSQSARVVVLLGEHHVRLWSIVRKTLRKIIFSPEVFAHTDEKIGRSFASGCGTLLFYEDQAIVENLQMRFPSYAENFPLWSLQSSGMLQFTLWTMLEDAGLGASLQHYNPLIDMHVAAEWHINPRWKLWAQMPFGIATDTPVSREMQPVEERIKVYI